MKNRNYIITYVSTLVIGILLLIYHDRSELYNTVVIAIGVLIALPSMVLLMTEIFRKKPQGISQGYASTLKTISIVASLAGVAFGIWMISNPGFFVKAIIYTLGAILILVGVIQIFNIYIGSRPLRPSGLWFIIPILSLLAGVVIIVLGPEKVSSCAGLIAGITLVVYAANGFASSGREAIAKEGNKKIEKISE